MKSTHLIVSIILLGGIARAMEEKEKTSNNRVTHQIIKQYRGYAQDMKRLEKIIKERESSEADQESEDELEATLKDLDYMQFKKDRCARFKNLTITAASEVDHSGDSPRIMYYLSTELIRKGALTQSERKTPYGKLLEELKNILWASNTSIDKYTSFKNLTNETLHLQTTMSEIAWITLKKDIKNS